MIIKQEPGELPQQPQMPVTGTASQPSVQQYVTVKGSHVIALSPQKQIVSTSEGTTQSKVLIAVIDLDYCKLLFLLETALSPLCCFYNWLSSNL